MEKDKGVGDLVGLTSASAGASNGAGSTSAGASRGAGSTSAGASSGVGAASVGDFVGDLVGREEVAFLEELASEVRRDYLRRGEERMRVEAQWALNRNFVAGNHYCGIGFGGRVEDFDRDYSWQEREVYNHIAPIIETRLAKLMKVRPKMSVMPFSGEDGDVRTARLAGKILDATYHKLNMDTLLSKGTIWSELTGSVFYKVSWSEFAGKAVGKTEDGRTLFEGDAVVDVCPSYEIYPDSLSAGDIDECMSIIHARAMNVEEIERIWGYKVGAEPTVLPSFSARLRGKGVLTGTGRESAENMATVIERYTRPTATKPNGELVIVAGDKVLYYGELPFINGVDGTRDLPFVKQDAIINAGCFFGTSVIERAIPVQRAYNAVKNRKHEFLNRISMGVLAVEDGSVDVQNLEEEGLCPGKILVYRQGSSIPRLMETGRVPIDFSYEEDKLLAEFISLSGVSEIMRSSKVPSSLSSGLAIQLLLDQDDTRLATTAERIRDAVKTIAKHILRLYKQFASQTRLARFISESGEVEIISFSSSDLASDDVVLDTENELSSSKASRQNMIFELLRAGLLQDENGRLSDAARVKVLDALDFGNLEIAKEVEQMHVAKAIKENNSATKETQPPLEIDDHDLHIKEHTAFLLSPQMEKLKKKFPDIEARVLQHIREHKLMQAATE